MACWENNSGAPSTFRKFAAYGGTFYLQWPVICFVLTNFVWNLICLCFLLLLYVLLLIQDQIHHLLLFIKQRETSVRKSSKFPLPATSSSMTQLLTYSRWMKMWWYYFLVLHFVLKRQHHISFANTTHIFFICFYWCWTG